MQPRIGKLRVHCHKSLCIKTYIFGKILFETKKQVERTFSFWMCPTGSSGYVQWTLVENLRKTVRLKQETKKKLKSEKVNSFTFYREW